MVRKLKSASERRSLHQGNEIGERTVSASPFNQPTYDRSEIVKPTLISTAALAVFSCSALVACGGGSGPSSAGSVYMGPLSHATVEVHELAADGTVSDKPVTTTTTAADGSFVLKSALHYPVFVRVTGGSYEEEATGVTTTLNGELDAVYLTAPSQMVVSMYSNAVVADARAAGGLTADNIASAMSRVNAFAGDIDVSETAPTFVSTGATTDVSAGAKMALALGAESQSRTSLGLSVVDSTQNIVAQAGNGDTLAQCNAGAGNVNADGSLDAPVSGNCAITTAAAAYVGGARNKSGIKTLSALKNVIPGHAASVSVSSAACTDRDKLLSELGTLFANRKNEVQAQLGNGVTVANWKSFANGGTWGPFAASYGPVTAAACGSDVGAFQRELVMAVENYWVDQGINYCHHHIPGWLPPTSPAKFRNFSSGGTSGGSASKMTCTANRRADGSQSLARLTKSDEIQWEGVDCSDFTSWVYNFAGLTQATNNLETGIGSQACSTGDDPLVSSGQQEPGVLLDINQGNIASMVGYLKPGDLLYITQKATVSADVGTVTTADGYDVSHVITWTGKHYSELRASDPAHFGLDTLGKVGSRLGVDLASYLTTHDGKAVPVSELGGSADTDPWMIIDSHYAGPAYRPFIIKNATMKADWYAASLSHVRRIIDADKVQADPVLAPLVIARTASSSNSAGPVLTFASKASWASGTNGYKLVYQRPDAKSIPSCYRVGTPPVPANTVAAQ